MAALVRHDITSVRGGADPEFTPQAPAGAHEIARLYEALDYVSEHDHPRTTRLLAAGRRKMAQKLIEEAAEVALEAKLASQPGCRSRECRSAVPACYPMARRDCGIPPDEVWREMRDRAERFGIAAKLPKCRHRSALGTTVRQ